MNLCEFESQFQKIFDIEKIKFELESGFFNLINNIENIEIKTQLYLILQNEPPSLKFSGKFFTGP